MKILLFLLLGLPGVVSGSPFRAVFRTDADEAALGPLSRPQLASVVDATRRAGAKAIVLKFFFDQPRDARGDETLAKAIREAGLPVVLQAQNDDSTEKPHPYPKRFHRADLPEMPGLLNGKSGWLPLPVFAAGAHDIGFINGLNPMPVIQAYQGRAVPSLFLIALELALGKATFEPDHVVFGSVRLRLNSGQVKLPFDYRDDLKPISFSDALAGKADESLKDAIVVIGLDDKSMHTARTPIGPIKVHRLFIYTLDTAFARLSGEEALPRR